MREQSLQSLRAAIAAHGGELLTAPPPTLRDPLALRCRDGHRFNAPGQAIVHQGSWCRHGAGNARGSIETFAAWAREHGGKCLDTRYVNNRTALRFRCARGHTFACQPRAIAMGRPWCGECVRLEARAARFERLRARVEALGYEMLSERYERRDVPLRVRCDRGHVDEIRADRIVPGRRCPCCRFEAAAARTRAASKTAARP